MRAVSDSDRIRRFMRRLGPEADAETRVYFTGGATAVCSDGAGVRLTSTSALFLRPIACSG